jgi:hypothetical protein
MLPPSSGTTSTWRCASTCRNVTIYLLTLYHIQGDLNLHQHCCEDLKSHGVEFVGNDTTFNITSHWCHTVLNAHAATQVVKFYK